MRSRSHCQGSLCKTRRRTDTMRLWQSLIRLRAQPTCGLDACQRNRGQHWRILAAGLEWWPLGANGRRGNRRRVTRRRMGAGKQEAGPLGQGAAVVQSGRTVCDGLRCADGSGALRPAYSRRAEWSRSAEGASAWNQAPRLDHSARISRPKSSRGSGSVEGARETRLERKLGGFRVIVVNR